MPRKKTTDYDNTSITTLKGADRVRKRPAVIFGSDGIDGCQHSVFEILSNSIDEAREGYGKKITVTRYSDGSYFGLFYNFLSNYSVTLLIINRLTSQI